MARAGRRPGKTRTREEILDAARVEFASGGFAGATMRAIARRAGVDPALVMHFYGSKHALFAAAMEWPFDPEQTLPQLLEGGTAQTGERLARLFIETWDREASRNTLIALLRSATTNEEAAALLREFLTVELLEPLAARLRRPDARLRASLVSSQLIGAGIARYVIKIEPLATADPETVIAQLGATIQRLLTGRLPGEPSSERAGDGALARAPGSSPARG